MWIQSCRTVCFKTVAGVCGPGDGGICAELGGRADTSDVSYKSFVKSESEIITLFYDKFADIPLLADGCGGGDVY